jgi:hypothetical protein
MRRASRRIWRPDGNVSSRVAHRSGGPFVMVPCPCRSIVPGRAWGGGQPAPPPRFIHRVYLKLSGVRSAGAMAWPEALPKQKWGPALLPAPTCTELRICRCSLAWWLSPPALRSWLTSSGVASDGGPARRLVQSSSAALLGLVPFASLAPRGSRELRLEDQLFRRLFRWSDLSRSSPHRHPVEIGPSVTCRTFLPLPALR